MKVKKKNEVKLKQPKTVKINECSNIRMVCGNEKKFDSVIHNGILKDWVGIGWIDVRKATKEDYKKYRTVKE